MTATTSPQPTTRRPIRRLLAGVAIAATAAATLAVTNTVGADDAPTPTEGRRGAVVAEATLAGATFLPVTPYRAYDSRFAGNCNDMQGPFGPDESIIVDVVVDRNDSCTQQIPSENLVAVTYNVTVVNTDANGFLTIGPTGSSAAGTSAVNWTANGQIVPNGGVVGVGEAFEDNGFIQVLTGPTGSTNFFIDITGYYFR